MIALFSSTTICMHPQEADDDDSPIGEDTDQVRKNRLRVSLALGRRKKRKSDALDPYRKFVAFFTRSENLFVNYYSVLDAGMAWETSQFGDLSRDAFREGNAKLLHVYRRLRAGVPQFTQDFYELQHESEELEALQKQLNDVVTGARGADIHSLREKGISYIELEQPGKCIIPHIDPAAPKNIVRGHNHSVLSRLLCPVKYLAEFDANPDEFRTRLRNNKVRVVADDFPALLYPHDGYDADDVESGLFRNPILLRIYKHIFTAPSSARQDLTATGSRPKIKRPQAMLNNMKAVTPGSIGYAALMFRHCISSLDDWRTEDDLFDREEFFNSMVALLDDPDDEWVKDTLKWWNSHVFGTLYSTSDDEQDREPSTADLLRAKRAARKGAQRPTRERTPSLPSGSAPVPASHHQSTPRHRQSGISGGGNQSQAMAKQSTSSNSLSYSAGTPRRPESPTSRYASARPPPLQLHNSNVPGPRRGHGNHSSPSPRNPERSRSPRRQPKTSSIGRQDYRRYSSPVSPHSRRH